LFDLPELVIGSFIIIWVFAFIVARLVDYVVNQMPASPLRQLYADLLVRAKAKTRIISILALYPAYFIFIRTFLTLKATIGVDAPYSWDTFFTNLDKTLHGGMLPWQWLYPLLSSGWATSAINIAYHLWFFIMFATLMWVLTASRPRELRVQYLIAFFLTWSIGGSLMAHVFASAGPVYYGRLGLSPDPYAPLMSHLHMLSKTFPVWALDIQERLWQEHIHGLDTLGGISAFPSMHNAQAVLMALLAWRLNKLAGVTMTAYAIVIAIGSVWLGWHYAVDGYASFVLATICWAIAGKIAHHVMQSPSMRQLDAMQSALLDRPTAEASMDNSGRKIPGHVPLR